MSRGPGIFFCPSYLVTNCRHYVITHALTCVHAVHVPVLQVWLFVGVLLILGSGDRWVIPLVASLIFTAIVILVPGVYEYLLNDRQRRALDNAVGRILPGKKKAHGSWDNLPDVAAKSDQGLIADAAGGKDAGLPRHRAGH